MRQHSLFLARPGHQNHKPAKTEIFEYHAITHAIFLVLCLSRIGFYWGCSVCILWGFQDASLFISMSGIWEAKRKPKGLTPMLFPRSLASLPCSFCLSELSYVYFIYNFQGLYLYLAERIMKTDVYSTFPRAGFYFLTSSPFLPFISWKRRIFVLCLFALKNFQHSELLVTFFFLPQNGYFFFFFAVLECYLPLHYNEILIKLFSVTNNFVREL